MKYFWALLLFTLGVIFLGAEFGFWGYDQVRHLWQFWPLILVFAGLSLLTKGLKFGWILMAAVFLLVAALIYGTVFSRHDPLGLGSRTKREAAVHEIAVPKKEGLKEQKISIRAGAVSLEVGGSTDQLVEGVLSSTGLEPVIDTSFRDDSASVEIRTEGVRNFWLVGGLFENRLNLKLNEELPLSLDIRAGATSADLDLSRHRVKDLEIEAGATSIDVKLGEEIEEGLLIDVQAGASDIKIRVPKSVKVEVDSKSALGKIDLPKDDEEATKTIKLKLGSAATSVKVINY